MKSSIKILSPWCILFFSISASLTGQSKVYINDVKIQESTVNYMSTYYGIKMLDGNYWYDKYTGAWGMKGGSYLGFAVPNVNLGGRLKADSSNGNTNVFVNGRELHYKDVAALQEIIDVYQGRYWMDAQGNGGYEGYGKSFNLKDLFRQKASRNSYNTNNSNKNKGSTFFRNSYTGIGGGSSGGTSYVIGKDWSVMVD